MKCVKKIVRHYWKYSYIDATTPAFTSQAEAEAGIDGYKMIAGSSRWQVTGSSIKVLDPNLGMTFDIGENTGGIKELSFYANGSYAAYVSLKLKNIQCSEDNVTWTTVASSLGNINFTGTNTLTIATPNNYRYIKFSTTNDGSDYPGGGSKLKFVYGKRIVIEGTEDDYDYYTDEEVALLPKISDKFYGINQ